VLAYACITKVGYSRGGTSSDARPSYYTGLAQAWWRGQDLWSICLQWWETVVHHTVLTRTEMRARQTSAPDCLKWGKYLKWVKLITIYMPMSTYACTFVCVHLCVYICVCLYIMYVCKSMCVGWRRFWQNLNQLYMIDTYVIQLSVCDATSDSVLGT